jgi:phage terminase Nu1 subunit (DNA packaging protein)
MPPTPKRGSRLEALRWTVEQACAEFDINPRTLAKRIKTAGIEPGKDGRYSTRQVCTAIYTDYELARARKEAALARMAERDDRKAEGELIETSKVRLAWESVGAQIKQRVQLIPSKLQSRLSLTQFQKTVCEQECDDALSELSKAITYEENEMEEQQ